MSVAVPCKICSGPTAEIGTKFGTFARRDFRLVRCPSCRFAFVSDPWTDYAKIYSEDYYRGTGADPYVAYVDELEHPQDTVRQYEWAGILQAVRSLRSVSSETRWLDYGCGHGGLVRHVRTTGCQIQGFEEGWIVDAARAQGIEILRRDQLDDLAGTFDIVTAIEVIEHCVDPLNVFQEMRRLLKPGGLLFVTTGNAAPMRKRLLSWAYFLPEIHVSLYEPEAIAELMRRSGFRVESAGWRAGWSQIIRFKFLKTLGYLRTSWIERLVPWSVVSRILNVLLRSSGHPVGVAV